MTFEIWTDGACSGNPGPGGFGWLTVRDGVAEGLTGSGGEPRTTNQRMELMAALDALRTVEERPVVIVSDSTYLVKAFNDRWWKGWLARGWKNSQGNPVANRDIWEPLLEIGLSPDITYRWIKGHAGHAHNEAADALAVAASVLHGATPPSERTPFKPNYRKGGNRGSRYAS